MPGGVKRRRGRGRPGRRGHLRDRLAIAGDENRLAGGPETLLDFRPVLTEFTDGYGLHGRM